MSRLLEDVHRWERALTPQNLPQLLSNIRAQQGSETAYMSCDFTWFVERPAPKTEKPSWQGIETTWFGEKTSDKTSTGYTLKIPVTTLCPCSRDISDYGAHSQRGWVKVTLCWSSVEEVIAPEAIFNELQHAGSAPIYPLLKREDERHVTMLAYDNPAFVEDTTRRAAKVLQQKQNVESFTLEICNEESIHTHDAIATLRYIRPNSPLNSL